MQELRHRFYTALTVCDFEYDPCCRCGEPLILHLQADLISRTKIYVINKIYIMSNCECTRGKIIKILHKLNEREEAITHILKYQEYKVLEFIKEVEAKVEVLGPV